MEDLSVVLKDLKDLTIAPSPKEARKQSIQRCIHSLVHACQCRDASCKISSCQRMKRVVQHTKACRLKVNGNCPICKQLIALCFYHAKYCQDANCVVPICSSIKQKMKQQQLQQRVQQAQQLCRRLAAMNARTSSSTGTAVSSNSEASSAGGSGQNSSSPQAPPNNDMQPTPTPPVGPTRVPHHRQALQQLLQTLRLPYYPQQEEQILQILKTNPQLIAAFIKQRQKQQQQQQQQQQQSNNPPNPPASLPPQQPTLNVASTSADFTSQNPAVPQPASLDLDMRVLLTLSKRTGMDPNHLRALNQLMEVINSPICPQQQQQIVEILESNPQLMEEFVKQKELLQPQPLSQEQLPQQQQTVDPSSQQQQEQHMELDDILTDEWFDRVENFIESNRCHA